MEDKVKTVVQIPKLDAAGSIPVSRSRIFTMTHDIENSSYQQLVFKSEFITLDRLAPVQLRFR